MTRNVVIASGLDPSGGAGLIADVRIASAHGCRPVGVVTALTVQDTRGVRHAEPVSAELVREQLIALLSDVEIAGGKIGMLGDESIATAVGDALSLTRAPIVWDPVVSASAGPAALYAGDPRRAAEILAPHLAVATPNLAEASALAELPIRDVDDMERAAVAIVARFGFAALVTGGHLAGDPIDLLALPERVVRLPGGPRIESPDVHGTGCALSTALACELAAGRALEAAAVAAAAEVRRRIAAAVRPGRGAPAVV